MVIFFEWHQKEMDPKSSSGLSMTGEEAGLRALASPLAGYLGKVQERAGSLEFCPWCSSKGLTYPLHSYRINLQESITLCTSPQCLFPLVSRSLEDVLASLIPTEPSVGCKRKTSLPLEKDESIEPTQKRLRSSHHESLQEHKVTESQSELVAVTTKGLHEALKTESGKKNGCHKDSPQDETGCECLQEEVMNEEVNNGTSTESFELSCFVPAGYLQSQSEDLRPRKEKSDDTREAGKAPDAPSSHCSLTSNISLVTHNHIYSTEINNPSPQRQEETVKTRQERQTADHTGSEKSGADKEESAELVAAPSELFWRNSHSLCWLDSLLVALVKCKTLRKKLKPSDKPRQWSVCKLLRQYEDICVAFKEQQRTGRDGVCLPKFVLQKAFEDLQSLRMSIFKLLQPKLQCKLGRSETPVFAIPLLLSMDSWAEPIFQSHFRWEFRCKECKAESTERVIKTLPTLTNLLSDWHPLHAVHSAPCNVCCKKNQRRTMVLESLSPVFALHFVEGLPDRDIDFYSFTFGGRRYFISTIIQYKQNPKHFITWIQNSTGSWTEFDDLNHPDSQTHLKLSVPAQEIHVVLWESEEETDPHACSPSSTFQESPLSENEVNSSPNLSKFQSQPPDHSIIATPNDMDIEGTLSAAKNVTMTPDQLDTSIGSTTLLDAFEGLSHSDIITLTLVELQDSEMEPLNNNKENPDVSNIISDSTPDSSTVVERETPLAGETYPPTSNSESENGSSNDPTSIPGMRMQLRVRGKPVSKQTAKKIVAPKKAPVSVTSQPPKRSRKNPAGVPSTVTPILVENTLQASPVSSTDVSEKPKVPSTLDQNARWSFLVSKHPIVQHPKLPLKSEPIPVTPVRKPTPLAPSLPNPVRKPPIAGGMIPKPQLKIERNEGLPVKAAEMYGAFGVKSSNMEKPISGISSPALLSGKFNQELLTKFSAASMTSLPVSGLNGVNEICTTKKHSSQPSNVPPGMNTTEALRYKLIKKLKAKKKKLAKLNQLLGQGGGASLQADSIGLGSPNTVTSSTYDSSICDDFLSDLLSPATTVSNLSPDSTGFLEMLAKGPGGKDQMDEAAQMSTFENEPTRENFLEDFLTQAAAQRPTDEETDVLSALEYFI